jgi:hypothetical protein
MKVSPLNPNKTWRGKVLHAYYFIDACYVEILTPGYEGYKETVEYSQIVGIE